MKKINDSKINSFKNISILIPALNPDNKLVVLVDNLIKSGFTNIIVVDDGSNQECKSIFNDIGLKDQCRVLVHDVNIGKGRALKTGFNYILKSCKGCIGIVTADADGQHSSEDIMKVSRWLIENPTKLILGSRNFSKLNIPFRSRFGNIITRNVFGYLSGIKVTDTQTGLRSIPYEFIRRLINVDGEGFEYEINMLLECKKQGVQIDEVYIETIYLNDNKSSHFNPIVDSMKIYGVFLKFISSSISSFVLDVLLFSLFIKLFYKVTPEYFILSSTIAARIISSFFNYSVNKNGVFKYKSHERLAVIRYYILCVIQMLVSGLAVTAIIYIFKYPDVLLKVIVDSMLSIVSFKIQKEWVFKTRSNSLDKLESLDLHNTNNKYLNVG